MQLSDVNGWENASPRVQNSIINASSSYNVDSATLAQIAGIESTFNSSAKNPGSSATGLFQHTDDTWLSLARRGEIQGITPNMSREEILNARLDPQISANGGAALMRDNINAIGSNDPGDVYLAHFLGASRAKQVIDADNSGNGNKSLEEVLGTDTANSIYKSNPFMRQNGITTASALRNWSSIKMTGQKGNSNTIKQSRLPNTTPSVKIISKARSCSLIQNRAQQSSQCSINTMNRSVYIDQKNILPNVDMQQMQLPTFSNNTPLGEIGTKEGLKIKSDEAIAGGNTKPGTFALGHAIQDNVSGFDRFTAFDDAYHHSPEYLNSQISSGKSGFSSHQAGRALDFTIIDPAQSQVAEYQTRSLLANAGVNGQVLNEYERPSESATAGHIHVNFNTDEDAHKFEQYMISR